MQKALTILCPLILLAFGGCLEQPVEKIYFPLDKAKELSYDYALVITSLEGKQEESLVLAIKPLARKTANDAECLEFAFLFDGEYDHSECYYESVKGVFLAERTFGLDSIEISPHMPLLKKPFKAGTQWSWSGKEGDISSEAEFEIAGIEIIEVKGREYEALAVSSLIERSDGAKINSAKWHADGIGLIKEETEITNSNFPGVKMEIKLELK